MRYGVKSILIDSVINGTYSERSVVGGFAWILLKLNLCRYPIVTRWMNREFYNNR